METDQNDEGKLRNGLRKTLSAPRAGAGRAVGAVRGAGSRLGGTAPIQRTRGGLARVGGGIGRATAAPKHQIARASHAVRSGAAKVTEAPRAAVSDLIDDARERPAVAVAIAAGALVLIAWIAWAIYVTASNGATAGLGVLITWPVLIGALALIAAPFVATGMLVKRFWPDGEGNPPIAGGANGDQSAED